MEAWCRPSIVCQESHRCGNVAVVDSTAVPGGSTWFLWEWSLPLAGTEREEVGIGRVKLECWNRQLSLSSANLPVMGDSDTEDFGVAPVWSCSGGASVIPRSEPRSFSTAAGGDARAEEIVAET